MNELHEHYASITADSFRSVRCLSDALRAHPAPHALMGGWGVFSHGSPVPSVDTDLAIPKRHRSVLNAFTSRRCKMTLDDPLTDKRFIDTIPLDEPFHLFPLRLGERSRPRSFDPAILAAPASSHVKSFKVEGSTCTYRVPDATTLAFAKLTALWGRRRCWEALRRPGLLGAYPESHRAKIYDQPAAYWLRKAGTDLFDLAFLLESTTLERVLSVADRFELRPIVAPALQDMPSAILDWGRSLADAHRLALDFSKYA